VGQEAKDLNNALDDYLKVIQPEPTHVASGSRTGELWSCFLGQKAQATRDFDQAFQLNPDLKLQYQEFIDGQHRP
jgi:hypothetical protein